jgi:GTP pyrophosphokinase
LALELHRGQIRTKTGKPTVSHLLAVAALVLEHGGDEDETIAALLHDGPEDCGGRVTLDEIQRRFGPRVAGIVEGCTDSLAQPAPPWRQRKERYLTHLPDADDSTLLVSLADKVHNVRSLVLAYREAGETLWERFSTSRDELLWYYEALLAVFRDTPSRQREPLVRELARALDALHDLVA